MSMSHYIPRLMIYKYNINLINNDCTYMTNIIDGIKEAKKIKENVKKYILKIKKAGKKIPKIAVILIGDNPSSKIYINNKKKACKEVGILIKDFLLEHNVQKNELLNLIHDINKDYQYDGILLQLPLPKHLIAKDIINFISINKDIDGFHPYNMGNLIQRNPFLRPCTPKGVMTLLKNIVDNFKNKHSVIVGASSIVGRPMLMELLLQGSTVTICHKFTKILKKHLLEADIAIIAIGKPNFIKGEWLKKESIIIDVGINRLDNGVIVGDVDFNSTLNHVAYITPVPGGVGPMTIASLLENTVLAYKKNHDIK